MNAIDKYLIIINIIGFVLLGIDIFLYHFTSEGQIDTLVTIAAILGGSLGIVIGILLFERKTVKENMMSRVFVICVFIIQIILFLIYKGYIKSEITLKFWTFFSNHKYLLTYLIIINFISLVVYGIDKIAALEGTWRTRIVTLLGLAFIGGSIGALVAMYAFRHKTSIDYFVVGVPLIMLMQIVLLFYAMNSSF